MGEEPPKTDRVEADPREALPKALEESEAEIAELLRFAAADPKSAEGRAARRAAESAYLRMARRLRQAARLGGAEAGKMDDEATKRYFRAFLARQLPRWRRASEELMHGLPLPGAPTAVAARAGKRSVTVCWKPRPREEAVTGYTVIAAGFRAPPPIEVAGDGSAAEVEGLTGGMRYTFTVQARNAAGASPESDPSEPVVLALITEPPPAPTGVEATAGNASASVTWTQSPLPVVAYTVTTEAVSPDAPPVPGPIPVPGTVTQVLVTGLTNDESYRFTVTATNLIGESPPSSPSNVVTPTALDLNAPLEPELPQLPVDLAVLLDPASDRARNLVSDATRVGSKWRFEYLKQQAIHAARETLEYEKLIATLMEMTISKVSAAQLLLDSSLLETDRRFSELQQGLASSGSTSQVDDLIPQLADLAAEAMLLPRLLRFLIETSPTKFWMGMFEAMIGDLAAAVFSGTKFSRTRGYLARVFADDLDGIRGAVENAAADIRARLDLEVDHILAPLRAAVAEVVAGTREAMQSVFQSFDHPLLISPPQRPGEPGLRNVDPFADVEEELNNAIDEIAERIKIAIDEKLDELTGGDSKLFVAIAVTYLVLPIVLFLGIALAGGPFSAAALAAIVLIAAQELIRLLLRWLTGPITGRVEDARREFEAVVEQLQRAFAEHAALVRALSPERVLEMLGNQLREVQELAPRLFFEEAAELLGEARNATLGTAVQLALAAEQSLGQENGTAFDAISFEYNSGLTPAPQLPGGSDLGRLGGAALLRDLGRLEQRRTGLHDGKDLIFTHRLSLFRLLGGEFGANPGDFQRFLDNKEVIVRLSEAELIDAMLPGVYRVLIEDVRATAVLAVSPPPGAGGVQLSMTHLGESRTRIKRSANPAAPPIELPACVDMSEREFVTALSNQEFLEDAVRTAFATIPGAPSFESLYLQAWLTLNRPDLAEQFFREPLGARFERACLGLVPDHVARAAGAHLCGMIDTEALRIATRRAIRELQIDWERVVPFHIALPIDDDARVEPLVVHIARRLRVKEPEVAFFAPELPVEPLFGVGPLPPILRRAYRETIGRFRRRIGKWGQARIEDDPNPDVRSLGFATLVRDAPPETQVIQLFPAAPAVAGRAEAPVPPADGPPLAAAPTLQYRPLQNRGFEGSLLLRLEPGISGLSQLADQLTDVTLDVTVRACYDGDLAAALRAGRTRTKADLGLAAQIAGADVNLPILSPPPVPAESASALRTIHISLRAHRDNTLRIWKAAILMDPTAFPSLVPLLQGSAAPQFLRQDDPFRPLLPPQGTALSLRFALEKRPEPTEFDETDLLDLTNIIRVAPEDLGIPAEFSASNAPIVEGAELVGVGIAVIPTAAGAKRPDPLPPNDDDPVDPGDLVDPLGLTLAIDAPLDGLLPQDFLSALPTFDRRMVATPASASGLPLVPLFDQGPGLAVSIPTDAFDDPERLYDVILSLSYRTPVLEAVTRQRAVR